MSEQNVKLDLSLDYGKEKAEYEGLGKQKEFLKNMFSTAVNSAFRNGIGKEYLKRFRDISKKIEGAEQVPNPTAGGVPPTYRLEVSLNPHELKFFVEVFDKATWQPGAHALVCQVYDKLEALPKK